MLLRSAVENNMRFQEKERLGRHQQASIPSSSHAVASSVWVNRTEEPRRPLGSSPLATTVTNSTQPVCTSTQIVISNISDNSMKVQEFTFNATASTSSTTETPNVTEKPRVPKEKLSLMARGVVEILADSPHLPSGGKREPARDPFYDALYRTIWQTEFVDDKAAQKARNYLHAAAQFLNLPVGSIFVRNVKRLPRHYNRLLYTCNRPDCEFHNECAMKQREGKFAQELEMERASKKLETITLPPVIYKFDRYNPMSYIPSSPSMLGLIQPISAYYPPAKYIPSGPESTSNKTSYSHPIPGGPDSGSNKTSYSHPIPGGPDSGSHNTPKSNPKKKKKRSKPSWFVVDERVSTRHVENVDSKSPVVEKKQTTIDNAFKQSKSISKSNHKKSKKGKSKVVSKGSRDDRDQYIVMDDDDIFDRS